MRKLPLSALFLLAAVFDGQAAAADAPRRRLVQPPAVYYLDADGDGIGGGPPIFVYPGRPIASVWVKHGGDCNDADRTVYQTVPHLFADCNENAIADRPDPSTVCVGDAATFLWTDAQGFHLATHYRDVFGCSWIASADVRRDVNDDPLREMPPACACGAPPNTDQSSPSADSKERKRP